MKQRIIIVLVALLLLLIAIIVTFNIQTPPTSKTIIQADSESDITTEDLLHQIDLNIISPETDIDIGDLL